MITKVTQHQLDVILFSLPRAAQTDSMYLSNKHELLQRKKEKLVKKTNKMFTKVEMNYQRDYLNLKAGMRQYVL